ncbi:PMT-domain-containing protein [Anaeromyces robustus]|jgi:dolichyl-phosphate-mannose-protein mannosyltransferase|uniref:Dolichyl-phosphate-mannose--protein mannosyltransferase n=1 Tax=Anaeromyces robustus TaxID=1754192 RepID=A0A1Y1XHP3_9FUNG|nr:PMT-domain-containing protein [Anaeromyces robustus]|eukprot:ORX85212.1 PMT-domain-containing protein [Anaeromyces robustus]
MDIMEEQELRKRINIPGKEEATAEETQPLIQDDDDKKLKEKNTAAAKAKAETNKQLIIIGVITALSLFTRYYKISKADIVIWDEAHFGSFGSEYIKRTFYFDVHPPLGKMLIGLAGWLCGYDGQFDWDSAKKFPENLNYTFMRVFCATFGAMMAPLAYLTARELHFSQLTCIAVSLMVICENAFLTISKFVLLDPILLYFTAQTFYFLARLRNARKNPFSLNWWLTLAGTGASLGCVVSVKWVGLFSIALVGLYTIWELWDYLGKKGVSASDYCLHWIGRIICLIIIPVGIYMFNFYLHFTILSKSGSGDANMSSLFQSGLEGIDFSQNPLDVAFNSKVTIKSTSYGGGLLHSHVQRYPTGSEQQQVTLYGYKDGNNEWYIKKPWTEEQVPDDKIEYVKDGDIIRLVHAETKRNLHSHNIRAPVSKKFNEVSGYGNSTIGDANDLWKVEIVKDQYDSKSNTIHALFTTFRLRHVQSGCLLQASGASYPEWGFKQAEVVCDMHGKNTAAKNIWNVESHWNDLLPAAPVKTFRSSFLSNFIDLNVAMWTTNNSLTPDEDKEPDRITSEAWQWPLALVGVRICGFGDEDIKFYLMGNPLTWWTFFVCIIFVGLLSGIYILLRKCHVSSWTENDWDDYVYTALITIGGWALHYFPSFLMGRVLYLHHYFPAVYFGIFIIGFTLEHIGSYFKPRTLVTNILVGIYLIVNICFFLYFVPLCYGYYGPSSNMKSKQWLRLWSMADEDGYDNN